MRISALLIGFVLIPVHASAQVLEIAPAIALADERISIRVTGLEPRQVVTVRATARDADGRTWHAFAGFYSDAKGVVDLATQRPAHGSYDSADSMGLIHSLDVPGEGRERTRFAQRGWEPWTVTFSVEAGGRTVATKEHQRVFARDVIATPLRQDGLIGTLFRPGAASAAPAILVLSGSEGGLAGEDVAALLASRGYVALALAYFNVDGLPQSLEEISLEYFSRARNWLARQPGVGATRLVLLGTSKGAEAALLVARREPRVRAVVAYAPSSVAWGCICSRPASSWSLGGQPVAFVAAAADPAYRPPAGFPIKPTVNYRYRLAQTPDREAVSIPVERIDARIMLIAGKDDQLWPSAEMADAVMARLRKAGKAARAVYLAYDGAGHLIGKGYQPTSSTIVGGGRLETGGTPEGNARAQADSWPRVLAFLRDATR